MDYNGYFPDFPEPASPQPTSALTTSGRRKNSGNCDICGEPSHGGHFGAEACRACTAFFRRSIAQNRKYICQNGNTCTLQTRPRKMCRACRLRRCIEAGMQKRAVQQYEVEFDDNEDSEECPSVMDRGGVNIENITPILTKMAENYQAVKINRKILHETKNRIPRPVNCIETASIHLKDAGLIAEFLSKSFEETNHLEADQRKLLLKMFPRQFILLEMAYLALLNKSTSAMILPNGDVIDLVHPETFFPPMTASEMVSKEELARLFHPTFDLFKRCILEPMIQMNIDETEFLFLCGIIFWDCSNELQSIECETLAKSMKSKIIDEIVLYLRRKKEIEPAARISSLMILLNSLQRVVYKMQLDIGLGHAFDVYKFDENFYSFINCNY